jgi:hypothetical protein
MSFRRSVDATTIAQLVGRMIRTPLARRIESDEALNVVELFLPHYDTENLENVLNVLRNPEAHEGVPSTVTTQAVEYPRNPAFADVLTHLATLKTYSVDRAPKMTDLKRALRLSGMLMQEGIEENADEHLRLKLTDKLKDLSEGYTKKVKDWGNVIREGGEIEVDVTSVAIGAMNVTGRKTTRMLLSDENIDQIYEESGRTARSRRRTAPDLLEAVSGQGKAVRHEAGAVCHHPTRRDIARAREAGRDGVQETMGRAQKRSRQAASRRQGTLPTARARQWQSCGTRLGITGAHRGEAGQACLEGPFVCHGARRVHRRSERLGEGVHEVDAGAKRLRLLVAEPAAPRLGFLCAV